MPADLRQLLLRFIGSVMSRSAILDEINSSTSPCCTPSRGFAAMQRLPAILAAVCTVALPATAFGQAPGVGSASSQRQVESVLNDLPARPERFEPADVVPLVIGGVRNGIAKETS